MKSTTHISLLALATLATLNFSCETKKTETAAEAIAPTLSLLWESTDSLPTNESVLYDANSGLLYVSVIEGQDPQEKDGKGSIALLTKDGQLLNRNWITGLNAPKGMAISEGKLYVTDIDALLEIDLSTAKVTQSYPVPGAQFLNDVAAHQGTIYLSDMNTGKVHTLVNGSISTLSEGHTALNGLALDAEGSLYGLDASGLKKWNADGTTTLVNSQVTDGDGLILLGDGSYLASRWIGEIWLATDSTQTLLLDTKAAQSNTADIGYNAAEKIVYVPTFYKNKVAAYKLNY
jgi:DNA-binding beta-propeller fold protein YncE